MKTTQDLQSLYNYVSVHINQSSIVEYLLENNIISYDEIDGIYDDETDEYKDVFQWLQFNNFYGDDYDKLIEAGIPVIKSDFGNFVGITSFGSHYNLYVYPEIINALFDMNISYEDITTLK